ncbi:MAG: hypothetical protein ACYCXA_11670 [Actinomycetes bacterium]
MSNRAAALAGCFLAGTLVLSGCSRTPTRSLTGVTAATAARLQPTSGGVLAVVPANQHWFLLALGSTGSTSLSLPGARNVTPSGVTSRGGIVVAADVHRWVVGFDTYSQVTVSPYATSTDQGRSWATGQLPGGLVASSSAMAVSGPVLRALVTGENGMLATQQAGGAWQESVSGQSLDPHANLTLTGIAATSDGWWLTGTAPGSTAVAYRQSAPGLGWTPMHPPAPTGATMTATCAPQQEGRWLVLPVVGAVHGHQQVLVDVSDDHGRTWTSLPALPGGPGALPWTVGTSGVWVVAPDSGGATLWHARLPDGAWARTVRLPASAQAVLMPAGSSTGSPAGLALGTTPNGAVAAWAIGPAQVSSSPIPAWVTRLGAAATGSGS